tara:strand:+ start:1176 stop:2681 length:1506 start_codon:yes stop_codon:yes gene_type:complete
MQTKMMNMDEKTLELAAQYCLQLARGSRLLAINTFDWWSDAISTLEFVAEPRVNTASVDKNSRVYLNPEWWKSLETHEQRAGIVAHEALHLIMKHYLRVPQLGLPPFIGNVLADMEINDESTLCKMLAGTNGILPEFTDGEWRYRIQLTDCFLDVPVGQTLEWYAGQYHKQVQEQAEEQKESQKEGEPGNESDDSDSDSDESNSIDGEDASENSSGGSESSESGEDSGDGDGDGEGESDSESESGSGSGRPGEVGSGNCGSGADGQARDYELPPPSECGIGSEEEDLEIIRQQIAIKARSLTEKQRGDAPAGLLILLEELLEPPQVNWRRVFLSMFRNCHSWARGQYDTSYSTRSRREVPGCVLPGDVEPVPNISMVFDTSGSMAAPELQRAGSEAEGIMKTVDRESTIRYVCCDSRTYGVAPVKRIADIVVRGGGGTNMCNGIDAVLAEKPRPNIIVVFTDGYTPWPYKAPKNVRIICCLVGECVDSDTPNWMKTVRVED